MSNAIFPLAVPVNEPVRAYAPGSPEKKSLKKRLDEMLAEEIEIPLLIGGKEVRTGATAKAVCPHDHQRVLATYHQAGGAEVAAAATAAKTAWKEWSETSWDERASILLRAADLLAGPWRDTLNGATMLNQSKTVFQAEIDSACELIDFWRFNPYFMRSLYSEQPWSSPGVWNRVDYRPLEGFVFAVSPFNFTAIGGNLPTAPALMGNTVLWKPASTAVYSNYFIMRLLQAAGFPDGVINFLPGKASKVGDPVMAHADLAGIHFTGSTPVFQSMWKTIGDNIANYRSYPRIVGETGGKNFVFAHPSADADAYVTALVRGSFEYQGQKCSAGSRAYVPKSLWPRVKEMLVDEIKSIDMGSPLDFRNFMAAVIDEASFDRIMGYIEHARGSGEAEILAGGKGDKSKGYFIEPTVVLTSDPRFKLMREEIFGPVLTVFVYDDLELEKTLELVDTASPYALTGAIFAEDRKAVEHLAKALRNAAGNFYINDKPTGAVVGQQPFGGARASGTNDKAGSMANLLRWTSQRAIKENFVPPKAFRYPHMEEK
ncbi:MAG TPA: L-glutamate gamma-semialdehyde dehydrogenase [Thermoanaerobaculia bacterium]|jgi:1-pyrroline-5-carboxylate dehydrogenase|nr:L-glutamate gamma-semialdehyde dehydrogenase [Thermoanaerobaculia bacterium]